MVAKLLRQVNLIKASNVGLLVRTIPRVDTVMIHKAVVIILYYYAMLPS